jgi:hypothetical protein
MKEVGQLYNLGRNVMAVHRADIPRKSVSIQAQDSHGNPWDHSRRFVDPIPFLTSLSDWTEERYLSRNSALCHCLFAQLCSNR